MIKAIYSILSNNTELNALVNGRIYPHMLPDKAPLPAIIMSQVSNNPEYCKSGKAQEDYRLSLIVYTDRQKLADLDAIKDITIDIMGRVVGDYAGYTIRQVRHINDFPDYENDADVMQHTIDFSVKIQPK